MVEEEFSVWKKNTPLLYDLVICHSLEWPSLTVQWLPSPPSDDGPLSVHKLILGTHTSDDFPNFLMVAHAHVPRGTIEMEPDNSNTPKVGNYFLQHAHYSMVICNCSHVDVYGTYTYQLKCLMKLPNEMAFPFCRGFLMLWVYAHPIRWSTVFVPFYFVDVLVYI